MRRTGVSGFRAGLVVLLAPLVAISLAGCVVVGGSTGGGWFIWPGGGLGLLVLVLLVLWLLRGRR